MRPRGVFRRIAAFRTVFDLSHNFILPVSKLPVPDQPEQVIRCLFVKRFTGGADFKLKIHCFSFFELFFNEASTLVFISNIADEK